jgi:formylglycine-generating enzyme required for sulfatase activity
MLPLLLLTSCHLLVPYSTGEPSDVDVGLDGASPSDLRAADLEPCVRPDPQQVCSLGWCTVPAGCFRMGSSTDDPCGGENLTARETPHNVHLNHRFQILQTEVTATLFESVMTYLPGSVPQGEFPVTNVTWHQAAAYCNRISEVDNVERCYSCTAEKSAAVRCTVQTVYGCAGFRLPTEAEWEYAYRAGTTTAFYHAPWPTALPCASSSKAADAIAWYAPNASNTVHLVAQKNANAWGLRDMAGNAWEWVNDGFIANLGSSTTVDPTGAAAENRRVIRGGSCESSLADVRASRRIGKIATETNLMIGFRCVQTIK